MADLTATDIPRTDAPPVERVLLASDGGVASAAALRWLIDDLGGRAADVHVLGIVDPRAEDAAERRANVRAMAELLVLVAPSVRLVVDDAVDAPLDLLSEFPGALLVMGAHRGDRHGLRLAEVAVASALGVVVIVPSEWICRQGPVVVGIGIEDNETATLTFAERAASTRRSEVRMIHAWDMAGPGEIPTSWDFGTDSIPERQRLALERLELLERDSWPDVDTSSDTHQGQVVATLVNAARTASLLVVGRSRRNAVVRAMFGTTAKGLVAELPCPVAVVP